MEWEGVPCYGKMLDAYGNDAVPHAIRDFKADVVFTLIDAWVLDINTGRHGAMWNLVFPVDHYPVPHAVAERFPHAQRLVTYSQFGQQATRDAGYESTLIPHGVDCGTYRPCDEADKRAFRRKLFGEWPEDAFIVLMVAANKGYPCRKSFPEALEAFAVFHQTCPEARMYLHSHPTPEFGGPNLIDMARHFGVGDQVRVLNPTMNLAGDYHDELMREIYCSADVLLNPAMGEGFGLTPLEAQACGTPVIVTDFSAMAELVGAGWRLKPLRMVPTLLWAKQAEADVGAIVHALKEAKRVLPNSHMSAMAREFALKYDWPVIIRDGWTPFLASLDAGRMDMTRELRAT